MLIVNESELDTHFSCIEQAACSAIEELKSVQVNGLDALRKIKFEKIGFHPLEPRRLNLIEQVNQTFTYLASLHAVRILFQRHPEAGGFCLNLGTQGGFDIVSINTDHVAAEVFAVTSPQSNDKLKKDIQRIRTSKATSKYVFFSAPGYASGRHHELEKDSDVQIWCVSV